METIFSLSFINIDSLELLLVDERVALYNFCRDIQINVLDAVYRDTLNISWIIIIDLYRLVLITSFID